mgnify:CR=1 FL=1
MSQNIKKNCNNCKISFGCSILKEELVKNGYDENNDKVDNWKLIHKVRKNYICDKYKSFYTKYPLEISKINNVKNAKSCKDIRIGKFVRIRPCKEEYGDKTYLGLYLGELPIGYNISYNPENKELNVSFRNNPAIFVFDLGKIIYGTESWWGIIENEEDLKEISKGDINDIWYVKALKELSDKE